MTEAILVDRSDPACVVVTLNRPEKRNALTLALWRELTSTFAALEDDKHARVVILTGAGGYFCCAPPEYSIPLHHDRVRFLSFRIPRIHGNL